MKAFVSKMAPAFKGTAYNPIKSSFEQITLEGLKGQKVLLCFYPLDFTFVCPTEIRELNSKVSDFDSRNCRVICCSTDSHFSHKAWVELDTNKGGFGNDLKVSLLSGKHINFFKIISSTFLCKLLIIKI